MTLAIDTRYLTLKAPHAGLEPSGPVPAEGLRAVSTLTATTTCLRALWEN